MHVVPSLQTVRHSPVTEIGVVLDSPQRQWAKFKVIKETEIKEVCFYVLIMWDTKILPRAVTLCYCVSASPVTTAVTWKGSLCQAIRKGFLFFCSSPLSPPFPINSLFLDQLLEALLFWLSVT